MALQIDYTLPNGIDVPNSYWLVSNINISPLDQCGTITLSGYASLAAFSAGSQAIDTSLYVINTTNYSQFMAATSVISPNLKSSLQAYVKSAINSKGIALFASATGV
jgi:hypothetical protein